MMDLHVMSELSRNAFYQLSVSDVNARNYALMCMAESLAEKKEEIFAANKVDLLEAEKEQLAAPLLHRLLFDNDKLKQVIQGLNDLSRMEDPLGKTTLARELTEGLELYRIIFFGRCTP